MNEARGIDVDPMDSRPTLFWTRMLRFSIYFTVFGMGLGLILGRMIMQPSRDYSKVESQSQVVVETPDENGKFSPAEWMGMPEGYNNHSEEVGEILDRVSWYATIPFMLPFFLLGLICVILCLIMRAKELDAIRSSQQGK